MALQTSGANADSYVTLAEIDTYWSNRDYRKNLAGIGWDEAADDAAREAAAREGTQYVEAEFSHRFIAGRLSPTQALWFPTYATYDNFGRVISGSIPSCVKDAVCELALESLSTRLNLPKDRGGGIKSAKVGPIEVEYQADAPAKRTYEFAMQILRPVIRGYGTGSGGRAETRRF